MGGRSFESLGDDVKDIVVACVCRPQGQEVVIHRCSVVELGSVLQYPRVSDVPREIFHRYWENIFQQEWRRLG